MRKLLQLIRRFWNLLLFLILEVICFAMISKHNSMQGVDIVNSSNAAVGYFYRKQNDVTYYFQLKNANDSLLNENARLRNEMSLITGVDTLTDSVVRIAIRAKEDTTQKATDTTQKGNSMKPIGKPVVVRYADYVYIPARVINNSIANDKTNYITLNRGAKAGIKKNMPVVTGSGIVGRVANVSDNYSTVVTVLSENRNYSAQLADGTSGFITWAKGSADFVNLTKIPIQQKVTRGDSVFTTQYSIFPDNIFIGTVSKVDTMKSNNTKNLRIRLSTNFRNLQYVYVVKNKYNEEQTKLEEQNKQE